MLPRGKRDYIGVVWRQVAHWIGSGRIAGKHKGLASAATVIDVAPFATAAGVFHPSGAAKSLERW